MIMFNSLHAGKFSRIFFRLLNFFQKLIFSKNYFRNTISVIDTDGIPEIVFLKVTGVKQFGSRSSQCFFSELIWAQTVCKGYQQSLDLRSRGHWFEPHKRQCLE